MPKRPPAIPDTQPDRRAPPAAAPNPYELLDRAEDLHATIAGLQSALEHHERLATLGTIAGLIAHEFNNILTPVMSYAQMALAKPDDHALAHKALTRAVEGTERAAAIASAILGFVRDESAIARPHAAPMGGGVEASDPSDVPRGTSCDVAAAVHEALACLARDPAKDGIELVLDIEPNLTAKIRPIALQHVLLNLLLNARRAMQPAGGTLTIRGYRAAELPWPRAGDAVGVVSDAGSGGVTSTWAVVEVIDSGCGMDAGQLVRLFKPFYTTAAFEEGGGEGDVPRGTSGRAFYTGSGGDRRAGTGLGMTICTRLIADCGGVLWARSGVGSGTRVVLGVGG